MENKYVTVILFLISAFILSCGNVEEQTDSDVVYVCSMDPQVMETKPGNCPICKMPLTAVKKSHSENSDELHLSEQQILLGNIKTDSVREHLMGKDLELTGVLTENQNTTIVISSRVMGRIEKLYFKSEGDKINKGQPVYDIYSEEILLALSELKLALEKKKIPGNNTVETDRLINGTRKKLILYGLTESQINLLQDSENFPDKITIYSKESGVVSNITVKEGNYVMEGESILHLSDYSTLWAEADVFTEDLSQIKEGMISTVFLPGADDKKIKGKISFVNPELNPSSKIARIRIEISNEKNRLKPGMQVNFSITVNEFSALAIPSNAILFDSKGATVWYKTGPDKFKSKMVSTGLESNGYTEIKSGLSKNEIVVISGAYLLNSEFIFRKGQSPMQGHDMHNM